MVSAFSSREDLVLENLALRQQLLALHAKRPRRRLTALHKLFWVALRTFWSGWTEPLVLVTPRTVVSWPRAGFRLYWTWVSRARQVGGRKRVCKEARALIFRMVAENPSWGALTRRRSCLLAREPQQMSETTDAYSLKKWFFLGRTAFSLGTKGADRLAHVVITRQRSLCNAL